MLHLCYTESFSLSLTRDSDRNYVEYVIGHLWINCLILVRYPGTSGTCTRTDGRDMTNKPKSQKPTKTTELLSFKIYFQNNMNIKI